MDGQALERLADSDRARRLAREASAALRRRIQEQLYVDVADTSIETGAPEPGGLLAALASGYDPRGGHSVVASILANVRARGPGAMPTEGEWVELADALDASPALLCQPVDVEISERAAGKLLPYLYRKVEPDKGAADEEDTNPITVTRPLSDSEIETFKERWADDY